MATSSLLIAVYTQMELGVEVNFACRHVSAAQYGVEDKQPGGDGEESQVMEASPKLLWTHIS